MSDSNSKKYVSKKDRIIRYLNLLEFYKDKKEGVDYILWYRPKHGWITRHVIMEETKGKYIEIIMPTFENYLLGKNFTQIKRDAEKAIFAWQVFGGNRELLNVKKIEM
jgi:hypothetical protein